jgi:hypothetical protein
MHIKSDRTTGSDFIFQREWQGRIYASLMRRNVIRKVNSLQAGGRLYQSTTQDAPNETIFGGRVCTAISPLNPGRILFQSFILKTYRRITAQYISKFQVSLPVTALGSYNMQIKCSQLLGALCEKVLFPSLTISKISIIMIL